VPTQACSGASRRALSVRPRFGNSVSADLPGGCAQQEKCPLRAPVSSARAGRRGLLWLTTTLTWLRLAGVQRGTRAPDQSANLPSWLTVVG
jgi:hypothetical protein